MHLSIASKRIMFLCVLVIGCISSSETASIHKRKNLKKNSPIYYIASPLFNSRPTMNGLSSYSSQVFKHHFVTSLFPSSKFSSPSLKQSSPFSTSLLPSSASMLSKYKPSKTANVYKLPTKFVSNAKPIEVVKGISKGSSSSTEMKSNSNEVSDMNSHQSSKKKNVLIDSLKQETKTRKKSGQSKSNSKLIYMPLKYISNGKTSKVKFNSLHSKKMY